MRKLKERLIEAAKLGYRRAVVPAADVPQPEPDVDVRPAATLEEAVEHLGLY